MAGGALVAHQFAIWLWQGSRAAGGSNLLRILHKQVRNRSRTATRLRRLYSFESRRRIGSPRSARGPWAYWGLDNSSTRLAAASAILSRGCSWQYLSTHAVTASHSVWRRAPRAL